MQVQKCTFKLFIFLVFTLASGLLFRENQRTFAHAHLWQTGYRQAQNFSPYIIAIPGSGSGSSSLYVSAGGIGEQIAPVYVNANSGPTSHRHSYTMDFDSGSQSYRYTIENFFENAQAVSGSIEITTTTATSATTSSGLRDYERWPVYRDQFNALVTKNGELNLSLDANSLPADLAFILVLDTFAPVIPPDGWRSVSNAYSIQASGALSATQRPYLLKLRYTPDRLEGANPAQLQFFWFDPTSQSWQAVGGAVHTDSQEVVLSTTRFGAFMLFIPQLTTPTSTPTLTDTPTATPTATPVPTITPTPTLTLTRTPTLIPTAAPTVTTTLTVTPTVGVTPDSLFYLPLIQR